MKKSKNEVIKYLLQFYLKDEAEAIKAQKFVASLDKIDGRTQADIGILNAVQTSIIALISYKNKTRNDDSLFYEALIMLAQAVLKMEKVKGTRQIFTMN